MPPSSLTSSPTSSPSNSPGSSNDGSQSPASSSLYLFTFLTTLLLLLAVSCGIVLRSFILRRRFRRRVEAAIAAGVLLPEQVDALRRRGPILGEKPKLYEVHIEGGHKEGYEPSSPVIFDHEDWSNIMPVSAAIIPGNQSEDGSSHSAPATSPRATHSPVNGQNQRRRFGWFTRRPDPASSPPILPTATRPPSSSLPTPVVVLPTNAPNPSNSDMLQLTVLIAMPSASARARNGTGFYYKGKDAGGDEDEEIPEVVFGTTEVRWDGGADWKPDEPDNNEPKPNESGSGQ